MGDEWWFTICVIFLGRKKKKERGGEGIVVVLAIVSSECLQEQAHLLLYWHKIHQAFSFGFALVVELIFQLFVQQLCHVVLLAPSCFYFILLGFSFYIIFGKILVEHFRYSVVRGFGLVHFASLTGKLVFFAFYMMDMEPL